MLTDNLQAVVLAAGKSKRFNTGNTKLIEKICGQEMIIFSTKLLEQMNIDTTLVVGYQKEIIKEIITKHHAKLNKEIHFVAQKEQLGTGHAVSCTKKYWKKQNILIMNGDAPLITKDIIEQLYHKHNKSNADISIVISHYNGPDHSYGRIVQNDKGIKIVEAKEFKQDLHDHCCINAGIYLFKKEFLENTIDKIKASKVTKEFYITSLLEIASSKKAKIETIPAPFDRVRGINTFEELWAAEQVKKSELIRYWMKNGVRFHVAQNLYIDIDVQIGSGTHIGCGVHLLDGTRIGKNCKIRKFSAIDNSIVEDDVQIHPHCVIRDSHIAKGAEVGPFAHLHSQSKIGAQTIIGNFVEIKKTSIGNNSCAKHLSYLGNANIGSNVNIGAGTITCNHNGVSKENTIIRNNAYIGSNNTLVAPVTIEQNAFTAAGSTITNDVPKNCLAIGRARQVNKEDYVQKLLEKFKKRSSECKTKEKSCKNSYITSIKSVKDKSTQKTK